MSAALQLRDFKDWIGPMVVKELRQGLRARTFVGVFIGLQVVLVITVGSMAGADGGDRSQTAWFWGLINLVFLVIMPLRGFNTFSQEARQKTLELVLMTRLTSRRITYGKWIALYAQTLLFAVALLPFIVMRYFLGGNDLAAEIFILILFTVASGALTALTVGVSAQPSALLRGAVVLLIVFFFIPSQQFLFEFLRFGLGSFTIWASEEFWAFFGIFLILATFVVLYMIDFGASYIAPHAENLSTRKRLTTLVFVLVLLSLALIPSVPLLPLTLFAIFFVAIPCVDALCEPPAPVASIYVPFVRRGMGARFAGRILYPGWQSGFLFTVLLAAILAPLFLHACEGIPFISTADLLPLLIAVSGFGIVIFPIVIILIALPKNDNPFVLYFLIQILTVIICTAFMAMDEGGRESGVLLFLSFIPWAAFFVGMQERGYGGTETALFICSISVIAMCIFLLVRGLPIFRNIARLEIAVAKQLEAERESLDDSNAG